LLISDDVNMTKQLIYEKLKQKILTNELHPGQVIQDKEIMAEFNIGRTPLREIFMQLANDGLIQIVPNRGTFVSALSIKELNDILEVRVGLEVIAFRLLCDRITNAQLKVIDEKMKLCEETAAQFADYNISDYGVIKMMNLEGDVHFSLYEAIGNTYLNEMLRKLQFNSRRFWYYLNFDKSDIKNEIKDLRLIIDALFTRNKERCVSLIRDHVVSFMDYKGKTKT
jgi:DNA-binding GntR family transcriptional regulator